MRQGSGDGPFGHYGTFENSCAVNAFKVFHHRYIEEVMQEVAASGGKYGGPYLGEDWELQFIGGVARYEDRFSRWLEDKGFFDEVPQLEEVLDEDEIGVAVPVDGKKSEHQNVDLTAYGSLFNCNPRNAGKYLARIQNLKQMFADYLRSEEGQEMMAALEAEGYETPSIEALAIGLIPKGVLMRVAQGKRGYALLRNAAFYNQIAKEAQHAGMTVSEYLARNPDLAKQLSIRSTLAEEVTHMYRGVPAASQILGSILEEIATKEFVKNVYSKKAKGAGKDEERARDYSLLAKIMENDINSTPGRYLALYLSAQKKGMSRGEVNEMISEYIAEALEKGYDEKAAVSYAINKVKAEVGDEKHDESADKVESDKEAGEEPSGDSEDGGESEDGGGGD